MATRTVVVKRTSLDIPLVLFIASAAVSTVFAENANVAVFGTYERYDGLLTLVTYALLFWLVVQTIDGDEGARDLIRTLLLTGYVVAWIAVVQSIHDSVDHGATGVMLASGGEFVAAFGSLGNPNVLGAFLAMVFPLAAGGFLVAQAWTVRILYLNVVVLTGLSLLLTFSRSAWLGASIGVALVLFIQRRRLPVIATAGVAGAALLLLVVLGYRSAGPDLGQALLARSHSIFSLQWVGGSRTGIWGDSLRLVSSRPWLGYGPDNVGLVFPRFQTGDWGLAGSLRQPIDKAHAEVLQVAATQGVVGLAAYVLTLFAFARAFWKARRIEEAAVAAAGWIGYQVVVQLNFTSLGSALPFWVFSAAALTIAQAVRPRTFALPAGRARVLAGVTFTAAGAAAVWGLVTPGLADVFLAASVDADYSGDPHSAATLAPVASYYGPRESVYAVEEGNIAFELGRWGDARSAYQTAADLGTFNALVYRNLALADQHLGLTDEARDAARKAVELDRYDPANQALLAEFETKT